MSSNIEKVIVKVQTDKTTKFSANITNTSQNMDSYNKAALNCWQKKGLDSAIKHMFTDQDTGRTLSYSEMRERYG